MLPSLRTLAWLPANYLDNGNFPAQRWRAEEFWKHWLAWLAYQAVKGCTLPSLRALFPSNTTRSA